MRIQVRKARAVKQKVWNEAENRERDLCEARGLCARKTLTARFTDFFTDFEKKTDCFAVYFKYNILLNYILKQNIQIFSAL